MSTLRSPMVAGVCACVCGGAGWGRGGRGGRPVLSGADWGGGNRPRPRCESVAPAPQGGTPAFLSGEQGGEGLARKQENGGRVSASFFVSCFLVSCSALSTPTQRGGARVKKHGAAGFAEGRRLSLSLSLSLMYIDRGAKSTQSLPPLPPFHHAVVGVAGGALTNARCEYAASSTHSTKERPPTIQARTKAAV